jgi:hypothetical protein
MSDTEAELIHLEITETARVELIRLLERALEEVGVDRARTEGLPSNEPVAAAEREIRGLLAKLTQPTESGSKAP